jgi:7,8-dihydropterin-6-yl-methyl-4-(beta-D-ribofuranosyl)aminobenzene 5'-phosphate synthase
MEGTMRITTLSENRAGIADPRLVSEWGLSLHIAFNGRSILFDTGLTGSFLKNAERLSIDVNSVEAAVLSHHHLDHGGGLRRFFEANREARVHLAKAPDGECVIKLLGVVKKYAGLEKTILADFRDRFETITRTTEILPGVFILPHMAATHPKPARNLYVRRNGHLVPDDFTHEIVMAIKEDGRLVIFTGCSHNGILNMVDTVAKKFEGVPIKAVIGGFHLISAPPLNFMAGSRREVEDLANSMLNYPVDVTYTGHCTGTKAFGVLKTVMGDRLRDMRTGSSFDI